MAVRAGALGANGAEVIHSVLRQSIQELFDEQLLTTSELMPRPDQAVEDVPSDLQGLTARVDERHRGELKPRRAVVRFGCEAVSPETRPTV